MDKPKRQNAANPKRHSQNAEKPPSWALVRGFFTCKHVQDLKKQKQTQTQKKEKAEDIEKANCSSTTSSSRSSFLKTPLNDLNGRSTNSSSKISASSNSSSNSSSFKGMQLMKLTGCYECRMVVNPVMGFTKDPSLKGTVSSCPQCGDIFMKPENLYLHQATRHAVSELGGEDTSKNIVEIIFQSSWLTKETPICKIDRILKVNNTQKTIRKFEEYRDSIKSKANKLTKKHPRCIADGNELLRFHCTTLNCSLGLNGSSNLCNSIPKCKACGIIKNGFKFTQKVVGVDLNGILTTATSGRAHEKVEEEECGEKRAMLVCRVIAGKVKKNINNNNMENVCLEDYDSVGVGVGLYANLDELFVFNPKAILPCFVVIYSGF